MLSSQSESRRERKREREQVKFHKARTNRKCSRSASDHTKLRHLSLLVLSCCVHFGTIKLQPTSGCPGADETFLSRAMKNDRAQKCLLVLLVSTLLNVGHIIPPPVWSIETITPWEKLYRLRLLKEIANTALMIKHRLFSLCFVTKRRHVKVEGAKIKLRNS